MNKGRFMVPAMVTGCFRVRLRHRRCVLVPVGPFHRAPGFVQRPYRYLERGCLTPARVSSESFGFGFSGVTGSSGTHVVPSLEALARTQELWNDQAWKCRPIYFWHLEG